MIERIKRRITNVQQQQQQQQQQKAKKKQNNNSITSTSASNNSSNNKGWLQKTAQSKRAHETARNRERE